MAERACASAGGSCVAAASIRSTRSGELEQLRLLGAGRQQHNGAAGTWRLQELELGAARGARNAGGRVPSGSSGADRRRKRGSGILALRWAWSRSTRGHRLAATRLGSSGEGTARRAALDGGTGADPLGSRRIKGRAATNSELQGPAMAAPVHLRREERAEGSGKRERTEGKRGRQGREDPRLRSDEEIGSCSPASLARAEAALHAEGWSSGLWALDASGTGRGSGVALVGWIGRWICIDPNVGGDR